MPFLAYVCVRRERFQADGAGLGDFFFSYIDYVLAGVSRVFRADLYAITAECRQSY